MAKGRGDARRVMASAFAASPPARPVQPKKRERVAAALLLRQMRFACRHIRFGRPIESVAGLYRPPPQRRRGG